VATLPRPLFTPLGIDHERISYRFPALDYKLTRVDPSRVVKEILL